ncbi:signal transduction histidine kinase [Caulobacter ginsengisoli]|uniref:Signal transduction histidine kinase n=1 Tax=Caulobacter ginsengisoli TaxID=400775 RepID=A0ABU0IQE8_9CAUL|nr:ATP-binding protein [Caulobacter ginsengisoli]MDQ0464241.1 signal transduction histidine kinase [Caulobacter ginsengisoli]
MPQPFAVGRWLLAAVIIGLQILLSGLLLWANLTAENAPGRLIASAGLVSGTGVTPTALPVGRCCAATPLVFRVPLTAADMGLADPALLISSAQDNAWLYVDGRLVAGQGRADTVLSRRPLLLRIPREDFRPGARIDLVVTRAVGFGHLRPFHLGEYRALYPSFLALRFLRSDLPLTNAIIGAFVAAFCFCAAPLFGARGLLLSLAGLSAGWALQHVGLMMTDPPWGPVANGGLYMAAFLATLAFLVWFFVEWTSVLAPPETGPGRGWITGVWDAGSRQRLGWLVLFLCGMGVALIAARLQFDPAVGLQDIDRIIGWLGLATLAFCLTRLVAYYLSGGGRDPIEASAFIFVLLAAVADIATVRFIKSYGIFLSAAVTFFPLALLLSLAVRARGVFEAATATADKLNLLVAEREREILGGLKDRQRHEREALLLEERARIMRDMHDGLGGQLLGLVMRARANRLTGPALVDGLEQSLDDLRMVVGSLEQSEGSLAAALGAFRAQIEPRCEAAGATLVWRIEDVGRIAGLGPDRTLQIYRILQEACTNALRHGKPDRIEVRLQRTAGQGIVLSLEDNGRGFEPATVAAGRGLANMRRRAELIGVMLAIESGADGSSVTLTIPPDAWREDG